MKVLTLSAAAVLALGLGLAACSPSEETDDETSTTASDQAVDAGAMAPSDGSMTQPANGTLGSEGTPPEPRVPTLERPPPKPRTINQMLPILEPVPRLFSNHGSGHADHI